MLSHPARRYPPLLAALLVVVASIALIGAAPTPQAVALTQNGFVFNDAWTLQNPGSTSSADSLHSDATNDATSTFPTAIGDIALTARFTPSSSQIAGTSYLTAGTNQAAYGGQAGNFTGSPTPSDLPALGLLTQASTCGGPKDSAAHQNFEGACEVGTLTLSFSRPLTDPVLDVTGLGGSNFRVSDNRDRARGSFNATVWNILTPGITFADPSTGRTNLNVDARSFAAAARNTGPRCDSSGTMQGTSGNFVSPRLTAAGCGSVVLKGTFDSITFRIDSSVTRFSSFPAATYGTGSLYFQQINGDPHADGLNGLNGLRTERAMLPNRPVGNQNADLQRVSLRIPVGSIGDRVWSDTNRDGIQDAGEPGLEGVTVELLDADGAVVGTTTTGADGSYLFDELPMGDYRVRFTAPDGHDLSPQAAGGDRAADSDADPATGESGTITLSNDNPHDTSVDAGVLPLGPIARPDETSGPQGKPQSIDPLTNDEGRGGDLDPSTLTLLDADGNPVDSVTVPGEGTYTVEDGKLVFTPEPGFVGEATPVDYRISDVNGTPAESTYTPTVTPVANPDETSGPQGQQQTVDPLANDGADGVELDPSTLTLVDDDGNPVDSITVPGEGTYTVEDGKIVFQPEPQFTGEATPVKYQVKDTDGNTVGSTYTPTVEPVTPVANPDETSGPQGQPQSIDPLTNDAAGDPAVPLDPDTLTLLDSDGNPVDSVTVPGEGTYTVEDGKIVFTPEPQFTGTATPVDYRISDTNGTPAESTYTPTVTPVAPVANPDETSGPQGIPQSVDPFENDEAGDDSAPLDRDSLTLLDGDGNPVDSVTVPGEGTYTVEDGKIVFTPEPQFTGTATPVDYRIADSNGTTATSTYTPTIDPVEPTASPDETSGPQGQKQSVDPLANDEAGDPDVPLDPDSLTLLDADGNPVDSVTVPGEGVYTVEDGKIVFTPEPQFTGTATPVDYRISDVNGTPAESTYTPTVTPVAQPDETSGPQGRPQSVDPLANDGADGVELDPSTLTLVDEDGNPVDSITVPGEGTYTVEEGKIVFTPEPDFTGEATPVRYQVKDTEGNTVESTYTPTVTPVTPTANPDQTSGPQGQKQTVDPFENDEAGDDAVPLDPDSLTLLDGDGNPVDSVTVPGEGTYTVEDGKIVFTPEPQFTGTATPVDYRIADVNGTTAESTYTPTINPVEPTANPDVSSGPQGKPQSVDPFENDEAGDDAVPLDPDSLTLLDSDGNPVDSVTVPGEGTYTVEDGKIVFTPEPQFTGTATPVDYRITDTNGTPAESTYTPTVGTVANPDVSSGPQGQEQSVDPLANDGADGVTLDADSLTLVDEDGNPVDSITVPGEGTYTVEDGKIVFQPEPDFTGEATPVKYQVKDTDGNTVESTYTPTVNPVTPVANPDETSGPQGQKQTVDPFENDEAGDDAVPLDPDSLTLLDADGNPVDSVTIPGEGTYTVEDGKIVFTPEPQFTGTATPVDYRIADANGTPAESTYTPTINPVTPTANPDETSGPQGVPQSVDPFENDEAGDDSAPLDRDSLTLLDSDGNPVDSVTIEGEGTYTVEDGKIVFTPEPQFTGTATPVDYRIADSNGTPAESTYTPTIEPVSPTATPDETSGPQGAKQSVDPLANDEAGDPSVPLDPDSLTLLDADGNPVDSVTIPGEGTYTVEDGQLVFQPEPGFVGEATPVDYRVADVNGTTTESTYTPTVTPVAQPDETSGPQGRPQSVDPLANDGAEGVTLDPDSLTLVGEDGNPTDTVTIPGEGTYTVEDGKIVFTPEPAFTGTATPVTYQVKDTEGNTVESTYTPTVTPVTPTAEPDQTSGPQGVEQSVDPLANDEAGDPAVPLDPDSLTLLDSDGNPVDSVTIPGEGTYTVRDGRLVFTPEPQFTGTATPVDYRIADINGTTAESTYTPTVTPVSPTANPDETSGPQGQKQSVDPLANDEAGDPAVPLDPESLTLLDGDGNPVDSVTVPGEGVYTVEDGKIVFTPEPQFTGTATPVGYRVADVNGTTTESTYTPTVTPVTPAAKPDETSGPQGAKQSVDPLANDEAGDPAVPLDPDSLTLLDSDGNPVDSVTVPGEGVYTVENGKLVFTPEPGFTGTATPVDYRVADVNGTTTESTYTPTVTPVAKPDTSSGPQGQKQSVDPLANDGADGVTLDPDSLTLVDKDGNPVDSITVPGEGVYTIEDGKIVFTPEPGFTGEGTPVRYQVKDTDGNTVESTYTPTVEPVSPVATPDETSGPQGKPQSIDPLANDEAGDPAVPLDPDSLTLLDSDGNPVDSVTVPGEGVYTVEDGKIVFTPEPQFTGTATPVDYQVADVNGTTATSTYTPTLTPVKPVAKPDKSSGPQGKPQSVDPLANDEAGDPAVPLDPDSLTLLDEDGNPTDQVVIPGEGTYTIEDGKIVFTPEPGFSGTATPVRYQVTDVNGTTTTSTYTPTVAPDPAEPSNPDPGKPGKPGKPGTPGTPSGTGDGGGNLPATGTEVSPALLGAGLAALLGGLLLAWAGRRRKSA